MPLLKNCIPYFTEDDVESAHNGKFSEATAIQEIIKYSCLAQRPRRINLGWKSKRHRIDAAANNLVSIQLNTYMKTITRGLNYCNRPHSESSAFPLGIFEASQCLAKDILIGTNKVKQSAFTLYVQSQEGHSLP